MSGYRISLIRTSAILLSRLKLFYNFLQPCVPGAFLKVNTAQLTAFTMADRRPEEPESNRAKRARTGDMDPSANPYLAHMYDVEGNDTNFNGYSSRNGNGNSSSKTSLLSHFKRHQTTALQAHDVEDGPNNPFNNRPLSSKYFGILKTRRELPVHKQR